MWPFSTIKNLRLELEHADRANEFAHAQMTAYRSLIDALYRELDGAIVRDPATGRLKKWGT